MDITSYLDRHSNIAFQFSGGKDSTAALLLLKPYWDRFTVYFCNSGDAMPETLAFVKQFSKQVPRFVEVLGKVQEVRATFGWPTDVLPWSSAQGAHVSNVGSSVLLQDRVSCCARSLMIPMHERMLSDGVTLLIRGQKDSDTYKGKYRTGDTSEGFEFLYPVQNWSDDDVLDYLQEKGVTLPQFYNEGKGISIDCLHCTAWCGDGKSAYLKKHHPDAFATHVENMKTISIAIEPALFGFMDELEVCCA